MFTAHLYNQTSTADVILAGALIVAALLLVIYGGMRLAERNHSVRSNPDTHCPFCHQPIDNGMDHETCLNLLHGRGHSG